MPLFKGKGCKSTPGKAIDYITNPDKAEIVSSQSLDDNRSYAEQFRETGKLYGKGYGFDERKYYHFKFSCDPADGVTPEQSHNMAREMAALSFPGHECVIATHTDKAHVHSHIIVNAINYEDGKKLQINNNQYRKMKDIANTIAKEHEFTPLDWRAATKVKRQRLTQESITESQSYSQSEKYIQQQHGMQWTNKSWKDNIRKVVDEAKGMCKTRQELQRYLKDNYGVEMPRNTPKSVSFIHPAVADRAVRGVSLGADYTTESIDKALRQNQERSLQNARLHTNQERTGATEPADRDGTTRSIGKTGKGGVREQPTKTGIGAVERELRGVNEAVKSFTSTGRAELAAREAAERAAAEANARERERAEERQRVVEQKSKPKHRGYDFER